MFTLQYYICDYIGLRGVYITLHTVKSSFLLFSEIKGRGNLPFTSFIILIFTTNTSYVTKTLKDMIKE